MSDERDPLKEAFECFKNEREKLQNLLVETKKVFRDIMSQLSDMPFKESLKDLLLLNREKQTIEITFQDPSIIMVGQTKAGKSSIINEVLGKTVVTADQRPCTARLVELMYGDVQQPIVTVKSKDGRVLSVESCPKSSIPARLVNLTPTQRENEEMVESTVSVQINNEFLKSGVKVIDSPGRNENKVLDTMVVQHLSTILPMIVYVIDGKNLLTIQDITDIRSIMENMPGGNIFYIVSKIDPVKESAMSSDSEEEEEQEPDEVKEMRVKQKVYNSLVQNKFLPEGVDRKDCDRFHALSAWKIKTYRRAMQDGRTPPPPENKRYVDDFVRFKQCLLDSVQVQLVDYVEKAAGALNAAHTRCLDFFIMTANKLFLEKNLIESQISHIQIEEGKLYNHILTMVQTKQNELSKKIAQVLRPDNTKKLIGLAENFQYKTDNLIIPRDGLIKDQDAVEVCRSQIKDMLLNQLNQEIHNIVVAEFGEQHGLFKMLAEKVQSLEKGKSKDVCAADSLFKILKNFYNFNIQEMNLRLRLWSRIKHAILDFFKGKKGFMKLIQGKVNVGSKEWKKEEGGKVLEMVNAGEVSRVVLDGIEEHIKDGHRQFVDEMTKLDQLYKFSFKLGDGQRDKIRKIAPNLARLELRCFDLVDRHKYSDIKLLEQLGKGAQGVVYSSDALGPNGEKCAVKVVKCDAPQNNAPANEALNDLALEIHYSRKFNHERLMTVFGTILNKKAENVYEVQIISERMVGDLMDVLPSKIPNMRDRVRIALQLAEGLKYLQDNEMIHRDIKCSNILVDVNNNIKLTDFGLCKPAGMTKQSFVGTPIHIAPEIVAGKAYNKTVDVYSFGIVFWYICEGKGNHPAYAHYAPGVGALLLMSAMGRRPERKTWMNDDCWNLMTQCWDDNPEKRPTVDEIITRIQAILTQRL